MKIEGNKGNKGNSRINKGIERVALFKMQQATKATKATIGLNLNVLPVLPFCMAIKYDASGFIIGELRIKETSEDITKNGHNAVQLLKIISDVQLGLEKNIKTLVKTNKSAVDR